MHAIGLSNDLVSVERCEGDKLNNVCDRLSLCLDVGISD